MRQAGQNDFGIATRGVSSRYRSALLATTALLSIILPATVASAQQIIDGGAVVNVPATQSSPWNIGGSLIVGNTGNGTLQIDAGSVVTNTSGVIANDSGSNGSVTVSGAGATWTNSGDLWVGDNGVGTLGISNGGTVSNVNGWVGNQNDGSVLVTGTGSTWTNTGMLTLGHKPGAHAAVAVDHGGTLISDSATVGDVGSNSNISVDGAGVKLDGHQSAVLGRPERNREISPFPMARCCPHRTRTLVRTRVQRRLRKSQDRVRSGMRRTFP